MTVAPSRPMPSSINSMNVISTPASGNATFFSYFSFGLRPTASACTRSRAGMAPGSPISRSAQTAATLTSMSSLRPSTAANVGAASFSRPSPASPMALMRVSSVCDRSAIVLSVLCSASLFSVTRGCWSSTRAGTSGVLLLGGRTGSAPNAGHANAAAAMTASAAESCARRFSRTERLISLPSVSSPARAHRRGRPARREAARAAIPTG